MPLSACCAQYAAGFLPSKLKLGPLAQSSCKQRLLTTFTVMLSSACLEQYFAALIPLKIKHIMQTLGNVGGGSAAWSPRPEINHLSRPGQNLEQNGGILA